MANAIDACLNDHLLELLALDQLPAAACVTVLAHLGDCAMPVPAEPAPCPAMTQPGSPGSAGGARRPWRLRGRWSMNPAALAWRRSRNAGHSLSRGRGQARGRAGASRGHNAQATIPSRTICSRRPC